MLHCASGSIGGSVHQWMGESCPLGPQGFMQMIQLNIQEKQASATDLFFRVEGRKVNILVMM